MNWHIHEFLLCLLAHFISHECIGSFISRIFICLSSPSTHSGILPNTHSGSRPFNFMFFMTNSHQVLLPLPPLISLWPSLFFVDTQTSSLLHSRCHNHLGLPCLTTSARFWIPHRTFYPSMTLYTSISTSYTLSFLDYADFQP